MHVSELHLPPKWKTGYSIPSEKVVGYSFLLKRKKEFPQFISQLGNKISIQKKMSSCCVIDKMHCTTSKSINVYIFEDSKLHTCLKLEIVVPKQHLKRKFSLLIYLSSKNNAMSRLEHQCMYIKCKEGFIWETFYSFFECLFQKSSHNIIGVQFYTPLLCKSMMVKELTFLNYMTHRSEGKKTGEKLSLTYVSKLSLSTSIMTHCKENPKTNEPLKHSFSSIICDSYTTGSKLKQTPSRRMSLKRKSISFESDMKVKAPKLEHDFCKKLSCRCHERNKWKVFKNIRRPSVINYSEILETESKMNNFELSQIIHNPSVKSTSPKMYQSDELEINPSSKLIISADNELCLKSVHNIVDTDSEMYLCQTKDPGKENVNVSSQKPFFSNTKNLNTIVNSSSICPSKTSSFVSNDKINHESKLLDLETNDIPNIGLAEGQILSESNFMSLNVPSIGFQPVSQKEYKNPNEQRIKSENALTSNINIPTAGFQLASGSKASMGFLTAAGKSLNISEKAILAAQKMFEEVCSQEINALGDKDDDATLLDMSISKKPVYPDKNYIENEFNIDFADKFFEEIPFDDKEEEEECRPKENIKETPNLSIAKPLVGKVRKSLGGRRSLKPYAIKK